MLIFSFLLFIVSLNAYALRCRFPYLNKEEVFAQHLRELNKYLYYCVAEKWQFKPELGGFKILHDLFVYNLHSRKWLSTKKRQSLQFGRDRFIASIRNIRIERLRKLFEYYVLVNIRVYDKTTPEIEMFRRLKNNKKDD